MIDVGTLLRFSPSSLLRAETWKTWTVGEKYVVMGISNREGMICYNIINDLSIIANIPSSIIHWYFEIV